MKKFTKFLSLTLILCLGVVLATGCSGSSSTTTSTTINETTMEDDTEEVVETTGGWEIQDATSIASDEEAAVLEKALENYTGAGFSAIAVVATQVVAGTNYCFLAEETTVTANPESSYAFVYVYEDLDGNAEITDVKEIEITSDEVDDEMDESMNNLDGGWTIGDFEGAEVDDQEVLEKALEQLAGATYQPIARLATQVVAGTNYCYLAKETRITANNDEYISLVYVYEDLDGNCEIMKINTVDYLPEE